MATGGKFPKLKQSKSETKQRSNWQRSVSLEKDDALSLTSFPSDIRINNWDLSDLRPSVSSDSRRRKKSKGNPEREREQSLSVDSPPHGEPKQRTPSSLSRIRNTPTSQHDALEKLKQKLTYSDDQYSTDGEPNNERAMSRGQRRMANNTQPKGATASGSSGREARSNRNNNTESGPDSNQIVGRLVQIRDYIKQASAMMESLQKSGDAGNAEDLAKVGRLISNLREQEQGYLGLLHTSLISLDKHRPGEVSFLEILMETIRNEGAEGGIVDVASREAAVRGQSDSEVEIEVDSRASESSESSSSSSSRPRIEDKLGISDEDKDSDDNSKEEDTALDNTLLASGGAGASAAQLMAARNVAETLNHLTQEREDPVGATGGSDVLTPQQRQQLMKIMMEKQEQLRMLQKKQDELMAKKQEAEHRLQQAQARDNQARAALAAMEAGRLALEEEGAFLDQVEGQLKSNIVGYPESEEDEASHSRETDALAELQRQLSYLRNEFSAEHPESRGRRNTEGSTRGGNSGAASGGTGALSVKGQQQQLQDKLQELQQKKATMDQLVQHLQSLRSHQMHALNNETSSTPQVPVQQPLKVTLPPQRQEHTAPPSTSTADLLHRTLESHGFDISSLLASPVMMADGAGGAGAADVDLDGAGLDQGSPLSVKEAQEKLQKLHEVRQRLNQLRDLVQYYQKMKTQPGSEEVEKGEGEGATIALTDAGEQAERQSRQVGGDGGSFGYPPHPTFLQIPGTGASVSLEHSDEDNASVSASDSEDQDGGLRAWDYDPEVQQKIRKLMKAKDKLRNLQGLIADIEQMPGGEADVEEMCKTGSAQRQKAGPPRVPESQDAGSVSVANLSVSEGEMASDTVPALEGTTTEEGHLQQQMQELARLQEERQRLLALQDQLKSLHEQFHEVERDSGSEARAESSVQKGQRGQAASTASVVTFASNDELYSKMRDQRIEREELRSKKKELEAIMKKDQNRRQYFRNQDNQSDTVSYSTGTDAFGASASADATMATWGGSTVDNLENITEDEDGQKGAAPANEDDGYPSDGIVQVEEEEEENDDTDHGTYTIDADARQRRQARLLSAPRGLGARPKTSRGQKGFPQPLRPVSRKNVKRPEAQPWRNSSVGEERAPVQKSSRIGEDTPSLETGNTQSPLQQFQKQLERMSTLCQNLMQEQPAASVNRLQQQHLLQSQVAALSPVAEGSLPAPTDLQSQLMRELQQQQLMMAISQCNQQLMMQQYDMQALQRQLQQLMGQMAGLQQHIPSALLPAAPDQLVPQPAAFAAHPQVMAAPFSAQLSPLTTTLAAHVPNNVATSVNVQSSRQTTFTVNPSFPGSFHYTSSQQLPVSQGVQTSSVESFPGSNKAPSKQTSKEGRSSGEEGTGDAYRSSQPLRLWEGAEEDSQPAFQQERIVPRINLQAFLKSRRKKSSKKSSERKPQNQTDWQGASTIPLEQDGNYRPGLSAGISGIDFNDKASVSSVASSQLDGAEGGRESQPRHASTLGELNLFEELRETIYTEVATLISQNESRPQYLISLFRELQNLTTDLMRQRAIFSVREIVQSSLTRQELGSPEAWQPWKTAQEAAASEMTPSESAATSDEEQVKASVRRHAARLEQQKQKSQDIRGNGGSIKNKKFDYAEVAVSISSVSTPTNEVGESPFSRDSLGDTVIHLDKALAKMRLEMQQAEQARGDRLRSAVDKRPDPPEEPAGDQGSESSVSDMPYPRIDAQELDQQIKGIMGQVIPVVKEHISDICSPQFLAYIQRLVLSLTRQPGHSHEFSRFFYGQLASILQDSLAKYDGRMVRECGEDLLLDMSEVLFNELAFLRIMKDLDHPSAVEKMRSKSWFTSSNVKSPQATLLGDEYTSAGNESDNESSEEDKGRANHVARQNLLVSGLDEDEDLGKDRDDELARKLVTRAPDEKDEDASDAFSSSAVHIQLAMSETKPFTRIGSDEDTDGSDESLSLEDPSDTAVSRSSMMENRREQVPASSSASTVISNATSATPPSGAVSLSHQHSTAADNAEKDCDASEADGTLEMTGTADGSRGCESSSSGANLTTTASTIETNPSKALAGDEAAVHINGEVAGAQEEEVPVGVDDLPPVLNISNLEGLEQKYQQEESSTTGIEAILNSMDTGEELAGDGSTLKEPESAGTPGDQ